MRTTHKDLKINKFEEQYPTLSENFKKLQQEQYDLFASKMLSYGIENISLGTKLETQEQKQMSLSGIFFRVMDKVNRWKNLLLNPKNNYEESLKDTYRDISNYMLIAILIDNNEWKK